MFLRRMFILAVLLLPLPPPFVSGAEPPPDAAAPEDTSDHESRRNGPGDKVEDKEGRGLFLRSSPSGARVIIDGIQRGVTPLKIENLRPGRYDVRLVKDGYVERRFRIAVDADSMTDISIVLEEAKGRVLVNVRAAPGSPDTLALAPYISAGEEEARGGLLTLRTGMKTVTVRAFGWEEVSAPVYITENSFQTLNIVLKPAIFAVAKASLSRPRFNPGNAGSLGTTEFQFEVNAPGRGTLSVYAPHGELLSVRELPPFRSWSQSVSWSGRDGWGRPLPDGEYTLELKAGPAEAPARKTITLRAVLDSSLEIRPFSLYSGKAGLLYAPAAALLPTGAFQIDGGLLFGMPPAAREAWKTFPFAGAFRFSPLPRLELAAALNVLPVIEEEAGLGMGASVKWAIQNPAETGFGAAAGAAFSWIGDTPVTPLGMERGIELFFPLQAAAGAVSFILTPGCVWTKEEGFPEKPSSWETIPRLLVSGGFMARLPWATAGLSARAEFPLSGGADPSVMLGAEIKLFPPPSSFVFSLMTGFWKTGPHLGAFGGAGIGIIY
jgi:hypothetical protein